MARLNSANLILLIAVPIFASAGSVAPRACLEIYGAQSEDLRPTSKFKEGLPSLISKFKPAYSNDRFDVRILSRSIKANTFSASKLRAKAVRDIGNSYDRYKQLGFNFRSYLQVLVEAHPRSIGEIGISPKLKITWREKDFQTPWVGNARELIGVPNVIGGRSLFVGLGDKKGFPDSPRILVLPATTASYHSVENLFVLAHELAHETENPNSHRDLIWREARADYLAYLLTGESELLIPPGLRMELVNHEGEIYSTTLTKIRSLANPNVSSADEIMPNLGSYHYNSQVISSALYELTNLIGQQKVLAFVHWMDEQSGAKRLPKLELQTTSADQAVDPLTVYVNGGDPNDVRSAVHDQLKRFGELFRGWSVTALDAPSRNIVQAVLVKKQI